LDFARPAYSIKIVDYTFIISELRAATLFDLYRLRAALSQQLEDWIGVG
jgi:hypothetical protein